MHAVEPIRSSTNPAIKRVRSLRLPKYRRRTGLFVAEGLRLVKEALDLDAQIETLLYCPELLISDLAQQMLEHAIRSGITCREVTCKVFETMSQRVGPQGLIAVVRQQEASLEQLSMDRHTLLLIAHEIQDPGNLGTILRTADACGAAVVLTGRSTDWYDPKTVRASMGSLFAVPRVRVPEIQDVLDWCAAQGVQTVATSAHATISYAGVDYTVSTAFLVGNEARGLPDVLAGKADFAAMIPMVGRADSLNVAVASALFLFEARRQRSAVLGSGSLLG